MSKPVVGEIVSPSELGRRDASHSPMVAVYSGVEVTPGAGVKFTATDCVLPCEKDERQAIADPFIYGNVIPAYKGFWAFLVPSVVGEVTHSFDIKAGDIFASRREDENGPWDDGDDWCRRDGC